MKLPIRGFLPLLFWDMRQIFLDCDGVLADFDTEARKLFGQDSRDAEKALGTKS